MYSYDYNIIYSIQKIKNLFISRYNETHCKLKLSNYINESYVNSHVNNRTINKKLYINNSTYRKIKKNNKFI